METQGSLRLLREVSGHSGKIFDSKSGNPDIFLLWSKAKKVTDTKSDSFINITSLMVIQSCLV